MPIHVGDSTVSHTLGGGGYARESIYMHLDAGDTRSAIPGDEDWNDLSGYNRNFTGTSIASSANEYGYWSFDGTDDYFVHSYLNWSQYSARTIEVWLKMGSVNELGGIVTQGKQGNSFGIGRSDDGTLDWSVRGSSQNIVYTSSAVSAGVWYHVVGTYLYNGSSYTGRLYLDGVFQGSNTTNPGSFSWNSTALDDKLKIGHSTTTKGTSSDMRFFDGDIGIVRIYDRALSQSEILYNYAADTTRFG